MDLTVFVNRIYSKANFNQLSNVKTGLHGQMMEFQFVLLGVEQALDTKDVEALAFLCSDLLRRDLRGVTAACELFSMLQKEDLLSAEDPSLLTELLTICGHIKLIREHRLPPASSNVTSYRKMLFELSEEITQEDLKSIKFLLQKNLPRSRLDETTTMFKLLLEMEKADELSHSNLETLEKVVGKINPKLKSKISHYMKTQGTHSQETGESRTESVKLSMPEQSLPTEQSPLVSHISHTPVMQELICGPVETEFRSLSFSLSQASSCCNRQSNSNDGGPAETLSSTNPLRAEASDSTVDHKPEALDTPLDDQALGVYEMKGEKRGFCLIINNYDFSNSQPSLNIREGTHKDAKNLEDVFRWLGFETSVEHDCSHEKILSLLQSLRDKDHTLMDVLVCCVLSHGQLGAVYGVDGRVVPLKDLTEPFSGSRCPTLRDKPKLFFVQACQDKPRQTCASVQADGDVDSDARVPKDSLHDAADILLGMSSVPYSLSYRDGKQGTWYIQSLCRNLLQLVPREADLLSILTEVNNDVSKMSDQTGTKRQIPQPAFSLRKKVVFPVPKAPAPSLSK
ncbi:caspase-8 isoform X2 [Paramormyrops kingsleyae]|uniref:Caspase-8 n=1 Tax=Paramormyrops kingsleyae TaxID=1676925 RepID=A0A3B3SEH5_9TELE|nr:caspase-8-like isoform X2 [Paramormyrops kingsleyae]